MEKIPQEPKFNIVDAIKNFNSNQKVLKLSLDVLDKETLELKINVLNSDFVLDTVNVFQFNKNNIDECKKLIQKLEDNIKYFEKAKKMFENLPDTPIDLKAFVENKNKKLKNWGMQLEIVEEIEDPALLITVDSRKEIIQQVIIFPDEDALIDFVNKIEALQKRSKDAEALIEEIESINTPELDKKLIIKYLKEIEDKINTFKLKNGYRDLISISLEETEDKKIRIIFKKGGSIDSDKKYPNLQDAWHDTKWHYDNIDHILNDQQIEESFKKILNIKEQIDNIGNENKKFEEINESLNSLVKIFNEKSQKTKIEINVNRDLSIDVFIKTNNNGRIIEAKTKYQNPIEFLKWLENQD